MAGGGQGEGHDRHIVDVDRPHEGLHRPGWDAIHVLHQLVVELDQTVFLVFTHLELHRDQAEVVAGVAEGVIDAGLGVHDRFQRLHHQIAYLAGGGAWLGNDDVGRGHHDLRIVFARSDDQGEQAGERHRQDEQGGELGGEEASGELARDIHFGFHIDCG